MDEELTEKQTMQIITDWLGSLSFKDLCRFYRLFLLYFGARGDREFLGSSK